MPKTKQEKIILNNYEYLGMEKGTFIVKDKERNKIGEYPIFESELGEILLASGSCVSVGALSCASFWEIPILILTRRNRLVGYLHSCEYDSYAKTRINQYQAYLGIKGIQIAKKIVRSKLESQNLLLKKYDLQLHEDSFNERIDNTTGNLTAVRKKLVGIEGQLTRAYYGKIFKLIPEKIRPTKRTAFNSYEGTNNILNLAYTILKWKVHISIVKAHLDSYLGFLHSLQTGKPSLVLDLMELYRYFIDDWFIKYCQKLHKKDFIMKNQLISRKKYGKRQFLNDNKTTQLLKDLYEYFETKIKLPRIRYGEKQTIESLIGEETLKLASFIRNNIKKWKPRIMVP